MKQDFHVRAKDSAILWVTASPRSGIIRLGMHAAVVLLGDMFNNKGPVHILLRPVYQHDGDYDRCVCGRRKFRSDQTCGSCRDGV